MLKPEERAEIEAFLCESSTCERCRLLRVTKAALDEAEADNWEMRKNAYDAYNARDTAVAKLAAAWREDGLEAKAEALLAIAKSAYSCPEWLQYGRTEETDATMEGFGVSPDPAERERL